MRMTLAFTLILAATLFLGCVAGDLNRVEAAREAHAQCVEERSESHPDCRSLEEAHLAAQLRYNENSRRGWGCLAGQSKCPTHR